MGHVSRGEPWTEHLQDFPQKKRAPLRQCPQHAALIVAVSGATAQSMSHVAVILWYMLQVIILAPFEATRRDRTRAVRCVPTKTVGLFVYLNAVHSVNVRVDCLEMAGWPWRSQTVVSWLGNRSWIGCGATGTSTKSVNTQRTKQVKEICKYSPVELAQPIRPQTQQNG